MLILAALLAVLYGLGVRRLARRGRRWPVGRWMPFAAGVVALAAAALIPRRSFTTHMAEHVLLGMVAPLLLALGAPITLALQAAGDATKLTVRRMLHHPAVRALAYPLVGWILFGGSMIGFYLSPLLGVAARNDVVDAAVHVHFVTAGALFLWPLVGTDPVPRALPFGGRLLAILAAIPFHAFLGVALLTASAPLAADAYPSLDDQRTAAALLWGSGELLTLTVAAIVFARWARADRREGARFDRSDPAQQQAGHVVVSSTGDD